MRTETAVDLVGRQPRLHGRIAAAPGFSGDHHATCAMNGLRLQLTFFRLAKIDVGRGRAPGSCGAHCGRPLAGGGVGGGHGLGFAVHLHAAIKMYVAQLALGCEVEIRGERADLRLPAGGRGVHAHAALEMAMLWPIVFVELQRAGRRGDVAARLSLRGESVGRV